MSTGKDIVKLIKQMGLQYGNPDNFPHITVKNETAWRLSNAENPNGVLVQSIQQAEAVLQEWKEKARAERGEGVCKKLNDQIQEKLRRSAAQ